MKKLLSLGLAAAMVLPVAAVGTVGASAEGLAPGGFGTLGTYTPSAGVKTNRLLFAMPGAWQNDTTKNEKCGGAAGIYWWSGYDTPDNKAGGYGWPGYQAEQVQEAGVPNLWAIDVPTYGNGENGDATQIIWNNYLDGGLETDPAKNPFYAASQQTRDFPCQFYDRLEHSNDVQYDHPYYTYLFKYAYQRVLSDAGVPGMSALDIASNTFWVNANRLCAAYLGEDYDSLSNDEKTFQVDIVLDELDFDLSDVFGGYADNFFNEDLVDDPLGYGLAFTFDNMVFVVSFDTENMQVIPVSGKIGFDGDFYFYYGNGEYGSWPTKELNEEMMAKLGADKVVSGNFTYDEPDDPYGIYGAPDWDYPDDKIYFYANPEIWHDYQKIYLYLYNREDGEMITWGSKRGAMTDEGNNIWSFDLSGRGYTLDSDSNYGVIFTADWGMQTCDLIITEDNFGDIAYMTGNDVENSVDSNKRSCTAKWASRINGSPIVITSIGNVIGDTFWKGEDAFSLMVEFLNDGIDNAVKFNGMTYAETISYVGRALGLDDYDIEMAIRESGRSFDWQGGYDPYYPYWFETTYLPDGTLCVTDYTATSDEVIIPEEIYGTPVTAIGDWAFANNKYVKHIEIPNTVTSIGKGAFYNCVSMTHAEIPSGVTEIKPNTFEKCLYLESVWIDGDVTAIGDEAFFDCRRLEYVRIPDALETVGDEAFYNCRSLQTLALPLGVREIGTKDAALGLGVFENCRSLEKLVVPESVAAIGKNAFESCPKLEIKGVKGSYTERFAKDSGVAFKNVGTVNAHAQIVGDVSQNNDLDVTDATLIQRIFAEFDDSGCFDDLTDPGVVAFLDVNGDGTVNIIDVTQIQRILAEF